MLEFFLFFKNFFYILPISWVTLICTYPNAYMCREMVGDETGSFQVQVCAETPSHSSSPFILAMFPLQTVHLCTCKICGVEIYTTGTVKKKNK